MKIIGEFVGKYMALIILAVSVLALFVPGSCLWVQTSWINYLLMAVMFGMGLTLKPVDFAVVFKHPKDIVIGCLAQFTVMLVWHNISGAMLAGILRRIEEDGTKEYSCAKNK